MKRLSQPARYTSTDQAEDDCSRIRSRSARRGRQSCVDDVIEVEFLGAVVKHRGAVRERISVGSASSDFRSEWDAVMKLRDALMEIHEIKQEPNDDQSTDWSLDPLGVRVFQANEIMFSQRSIKDRFRDGRPLQELIKPAEAG